MITLTNPQGVTLKTAGKWCDSDYTVVPNLQAKDVAPTNAEQIVTADAGYCGLSRVTVGASQGGAGEYMGEDIPSKVLLDSLELDEDDSFVYFAYMGKIGEWQGFTAPFFQWYFSASAGTVAIDRGTITDGVFTVEETTTHNNKNIFLTYNWRTDDKAVVFRVRPTNEDAYINGFRKNNTNYTDGQGNEWTTQYQPCLSVKCGYLKGTFSFGNTNQKSYMFLESLDVRNWEITGAGESWGIGNCVNLKFVDFRLKKKTPAINMSRWFCGCNQLRRILLANLTTTDASSMFEGDSSLEEIDLTACDLSQCTTISRLCPDCPTLTSLVLPDELPIVTNMSESIRKCLLKKFTLPYMPNMANLTNIFGYNYFIKELVHHADNVNYTNISNIGFDAISITYPREMFAVTTASNLVSRWTLHLPRGIAMAISFNISSATRLTHEALLNVLNSIKDLSGQTTQTLTMGSTNLAKLSAEEKAIATAKNWTLA